MQTKLLISLMTIGLVASVIGVGTFAYFSDTETSTGNSMAAGRLDLKVNGGDLDDATATLHIAIADMKPSKTVLGPLTTLRIVDNPGKLYKMITNVVCNQGTSSEPEVEREKELTDTCPIADDNGGVDGVCDLDAVTWLDMTLDGNVYIPDQTVTIGELKGKWIYLGEFPALTDVVVQQSFHMVSAAGNEYQGDACTFDEVFMVRQVNAPRMEPLPWQPNPVVPAPIAP